MTVMKQTRSWKGFSLPSTYMVTEVHKHVLGPILVTLFCVLCIFYHADSYSDNHEGMYLTTCENCDVKSAIQFGKKLKHSTFATMTFLSLEDCVQECGKRPRCLSMNYEQRLRVCELNDRDEQYYNLYLVDTNGSLYTEKSNWNESFLFKVCNPQGCNDQQMCFASESGTDGCEVSDCSYPPYEECSTNDWDRQMVVGSRVQYSCREGYEMVGESGRITCLSNGLWSPIRFSCKRVMPFDCDEVRERGYIESGYYTICPSCYPTNVYCDINEENESWTVLLARFDASLNFNRSWYSYYKGFGQGKGNYWIGNENIYLLTSDRSVDVKFVLTKYGSGLTYNYTYANFKVGTYSDGYRLSFEMNQLDQNQGYTSICGHSNCHQGMTFSTYNMDNDNYANKSCAAIYGGGWWYNACHSVCLTGSYNVTYGYRWKCVDGADVNGYLSSSYMMIRKRVETDYTNE